MLSPDEYNYPHFDDFIIGGGDRIFDAFRRTNFAGDQAPDGSVTKLSDRAVVALSDLWDERPVVLEFGSFT